MKRLTIWNLIKASPLESAVMLTVAAVVAGLSLLVLSYLTAA